MTTTDHAIVAPAVTGDPGTRDDAGGFDPACPDEGNWYPIKTAPRNGTWITIGDDDKEWWPARWQNGAWSHSRACDIPPEFTPTRWHVQPQLPAPPTARKDSWWQSRKPVTFERVAEDDEEFPLVLIDAAGARCALVASEWYAQEFISRASRAPATPDPIPQPEGDAPPAPAQSAGATADGYAQPEALHAFASFVCRAYAIDAAAAQDEAERLGLFTKVPYDPKTHGESAAELGEEILLLKPLASSRAAAEDDTAFVRRMNRTKRPDRLPEEDARLRALARRGARPHEPADASARSAARAWLHTYGIKTERYTSGGGDHPAMDTLPAAFEAFASARSARGEVAEAVLAISTQDVDPPYNEALERMRWNAEEAECVRMFLDKRDVPRADETGDFSLVGRVMRYAKAELGESYELGKRIGFVEAVQHIDLHTGGRGVATVINGKLDASALIEQICKRLSLGEDAVAAVTDAVTAEREACAQEAEQRNTAGHDAKRPWTVPHATDERACAICYSAMREAQEIAAAIRARSTPAAVLDRARPADEPGRNDDLKQIWAKIEVGDIDPVIGFPPVTAIEFCGVRFASAAVLDRARPAGQGEGDGWLPIATAPKNGTLVDLWAQRDINGSVGRYTDCRWARRHYGTVPFGDPCWLGLDDTYSTCTPTHWRPLPVPPSAAAAPPAPASRATSAPAQDAGPAGVTEAWLKWRDKNLYLDRNRPEALMVAFTGGYAAARARTPDAGKETGR